QTPTIASLMGFRWFLRSGHLWNDTKMRRFLPSDVIAERQSRLEQGWAITNSTGRDSPDVLQEMSEAAGRIVEAGGMVAMGSHGDVPGAGAHYELWALAAGGMPLYDVLRCGTIWSATAIGHAADLGSIEVGKLADLLVLDENPLQDIRNTATI